MNRKEALALGEPRYNTGKRCKRGHTSDRYTRSGACLECGLMRVYSWKKENPEKVKRWSAECWQNATSEDKVVRNRRRRIARRKYFRLGKVALDGGEQKLVDNLYQFCSWLTETTGIPMEVDHVIPLCKGGAHHPGNLRIVTAQENRRKGGKLSVAEPFP